MAGLFLLGFLEGSGAFPVHFQTAEMSIFDRETPLA
jgi:hypothetical protein